MVQQTWNPADYEKNARFVTNLGSGVLDLLAPQPGERILDLGCGDGVLTRKIQERGCSVVGVDASSEFIVAAKSLGLDARLMDAHALTFEREFDAVFSNAALHWMKGQPKVLEGVWRALKPGGRFGAEMGGHGNIAGIEAALWKVLQNHELGHLRTDINFYPTAEQYRTLLEKQGFQVRSMDLFPRSTPLPKDMKAWLGTFRKSVIEAVPENLRQVILEEAQEALRPTHCDAQGRWTADYVRLRFAARKP
jgi:trans-aconitate methyltransferase